MVVHQMHVCHKKVANPYQPAPCVNSWVVDQSVKVIWIFHSFQFSSLLFVMSDGVLCALLYDTVLLLQLLLLVLLAA